MGFSAYNSDPNANLTISGINIAEGCPPSGINNAIRQLMADAKAENTATIKNTGAQTISGSAAFLDAVTIANGATVTSGGMTVTGDTVISGGASVTSGLTVTSGATISGGVTVTGNTVISGGASVTSDLAVDGGITVTSGASISGNLTVNSAVIAYKTSGGSASLNSFVGMGAVYVDNLQSGGLEHRVSLQANSAGVAGVYDNTYSKWLLQSTSAGEVTVSGHATEDVTLATAQTITGAKTHSADVVMTSGTEIRMSVSDNYLYLRGGTNNDFDGARLALSGVFRSSYVGSFRLMSVDGGGNTYVLYGTGGGSLSWDGKTVSTTSDERKKTTLTAIPDDVLDAWGDVNWGQFKYLESIERKGDNARLHTGLIAQAIVRAFAARGLDATAYGLVCHEEQAAVDDEPAVDMWMVRYEEAQAMEAAYQRRRADRLEARIAALEARLGE